MAPKKRSLTAKSSQVRGKIICMKKCQDLQESSEHNNVLRTCAENIEELYLSLLPNEVLLIIYKYLSPVDLLSLSELDNQRLTDLTYTMREANFSFCRRDNPLLVTSFFTRVRVKYIQKLNFSYCFYIKPYDLTNLICKCKNLTILSVIDCGLNYNNIINILQSCTNLEELAWKVEQIAPINICWPNLKRVYLFCEFALRKSILDNIQIFSQVKNVWVNFYSDSLSALPFIGLWLTCVSSDILSRHFTLIINMSFCHKFFPNHFILRNELFGREHKLISEGSIGSGMCSYPPYLQMRSINEDILSLSSGSFKAYSTLAIVLTQEFISISENLVKCIQEIAGDKLKHLSVQLDEHNFSVNEDLPERTKELVAFYYDKTCDFMEKVFLTSKYITVLNLTTIHFSTESPIRAIMQLSYLKVLNIPSCVFNNSANLENSKNFGLSAVVSSCPEVEDFVLNCCVDSKEKLTEESIVCVKNWTRLKHLSIYSITFRTCRFLRKVADSCINLLSLSLITVAPKNVCLYTGDVIYLLKKAKNLRLIRINDEKFNPMFECFWPAIGEAVNLEGVCISTRVGVHVAKQTVISEVKKLKYLHLFHFHAPKAPERLYIEVKKSMQDHGIKNVKVDIGYTNYCSDLLSYYVRYYHKQPDFCCHLLHLKDFDIF